MKINLDIDLEECYNIEDIIYEAKERIISEVLSKISFDVGEPVTFFAKELMKDEKIIALIKTRKEQLRQLLQEEVDDFESEDKQ